MKKSFRQLFFVIGAVLFASFALTACGPNDPGNGEGEGEGEGETTTAEYKFSKGELSWITDGPTNSIVFNIELQDKETASNTIILTIRGIDNTPIYSPVVGAYPVKTEAGGAAIIADLSYATVGGIKYPLTAGSVEIKGSGDNYTIEGSLTYNGKTAKVSGALTQFTNYPYGLEIGSLSGNAMGKQLTKGIANMEVQMQGSKVRGASVIMELYNGTIERPTDYLFLSFAIDSTEAKNEIIDGQYQLAFAPPGQVLIGFANASTGTDITTGNHTPIYFLFDEMSKMAFMTAGGLDITTNNGRTTVVLEGTSYTGKQIQVTYNGVLDWTNAPSGVAPLKIAER